MSTILNDLIATDATGFSVGDSFTPGAGLTGITDSAIVTPWTDASALAEGDRIFLNGANASIGDISTLTAEVTYTDATGTVVTTTMTLLAVEVTDEITLATTQMLIPLDSSGDLVNISSITITATDTTPGLTQIPLTDLASDDTVSLASATTIDGTAGNDAIAAGWSDADGDVVGDTGNRIDAGAGNDVVYAGLGDDTISGGDGNDSLFGGAGDDVISGNDGADSIWGDAGNDTLYGNEGDDKLIGGAGDDLIVGGAGNNTLYGDGAMGDTGGWSADDAPEAGFGNDTLVLGLGDDTAYGGSGDDLFRMFDDFGNHVITGGEAGETTGDKIMAQSVTQDTTLIYTGDETGTLTNGTNTASFSEIERVYLGSGDDYAEILTSTSGHVSGGDGFDTLVVPDGTDPASIVVTSSTVNDDGTVSQDGYVIFADGTKMTFEKFEEIICFTPGTLIDTLRGRIAVEDLAPGDKVLTRDHGYQTLAWTGRRDLSAEELALCPAAAPVRIAAGALGRNLPERDLTVSPRHRMLVTGARAELMFGEREVLVAAGDLMGLPGVSRVTEGPVSYVHVMCEAHQIIRAEGSWTESFQPADAVVNALDSETRAELLALFPELATAAGRAGYVAARPVLNGAEVRELFAA